MSDKYTEVILPQLRQKEAELELDMDKAFARYNKVKQKRWPSYSQWVDYQKVSSDHLYYEAALATIELWLNGEMPKTNIYLVDGGDMSVVADSIDFGSDEVGSIMFNMYEDERVFEIIAADTRGQARAVFAQKHDLDFTDTMSIHKIAEEPLPPGIVPFDDTDDVTAIFGFWEIIESRQLLAHQQPQPDSE